jgi:hypothetical protein
MLFEYCFDLIKDSMIFGWYLDCGILNNLHIPSIVYSSKTGLMYGLCYLCFTCMISC